ncbi:MAG: geranylgeranylglyceryl/heptaprenylglyceryl phosphate synthase [Candidatus Undinarchaeales archaeon]
MTIYQKLLRKMKKEKLHFSLFDPENMKPEKAAELASKSEEFGTDAIMIGGSTTGSVDNFTKAIHEAVDIPVILFPNSAKAVSKHADGIFFMSLLNSNKRQYLVGEQIKGAPFVKKYGLEPMGMGYIVVNTGEPTAVEKVAQIQQLKPKEIVSNALAAQYFGMDLVYLEAGSGAQKSVSTDVIRKVKNEIDIPLIVGGGINGPVTAINKMKAGADVIVTGTVIERVYSKVAEIIDAVKGFEVKNK